MKPKLVKACEEMRLRLVNKERDMEAREQRRQAWEAGRAERQREGNAFRGMGSYLAGCDRRMKKERYVTAMYGCKTSWPRLLEYSKYYLYFRIEGRRRANRPPEGGNWQFNTRPRPVVPPLRKAA